MQPSEHAELSERGSRCQRLAEVQPDVTICVIDEIRAARESVLVPKLEYLRTTLQSG